MVTDRTAVCSSGAAPSRVYVRSDRDQLLLMAVSMRDWLDEGHLAWFVIDVVGELDTRALQRRPGGAPGRPPYDPEMMCALLLYAYCCGMRSSRQIEASCRTDAAFRVICGGPAPDHATIARFVVDHEQALGGLFTSGLRLCGAAGIVDLSLVALDGTKMAADAALDCNRDGAWIEREVEKLLAATAAESAAQPGQDALAGLGLDGQASGELAGRGGRLARLRPALEVVEAEERAAAQRAEAATKAIQEAAREGRKLNGRKPKDPAAALARAQADHKVALSRAEDKQARRAAKQQAAGRKLGGPAPGPDRDLQRAADALAGAQKAVDEAPPPTRAQANITDPDSRIMKTATGWVQGYNAQAIADNGGIVLACDVSQDTGDALLYQPMMTRLADTLTAAAITAAIERALADAGYWSDANATAEGPDRLIATMKDHKQRRAARDLGQTTGEPPEDATAAEAMEHRLRTAEGATAYARRSCTIEPTFGDIKTNRAMPGFRRRGLPAAKSEWSFINLAGNMLKLRRHLAAATAA